MPKHNKCGCNCVPEASFNRFAEKHAQESKETRQGIDASLKAGSKREEKFVQKLVSIGKDVEGLRQKLQDSERKVTALEKRVEELKSCLQQKSKCSPSTKAHREDSPRTFVQAPDDACEILVTGLPSSLKESPSAVVKRLLSFISLSSALNHVLTTREWQPKTYKGSARAVAVKFSSQIVRNEVLKAFYALKHLNTKDMFAADYHFKLKLTHLLSKSTHSLFTKACKVSQSCDFAPPIVKNGIVYIRKSNCSMLIPIYSDKDFEILNCASQATTSK